IIAQDGHNDFPYIIRGWYLNQVNGADFTIEKMPIGQTDIQRMRDGQVGGQFWSAYVPRPLNKFDSSEENLLCLQRTLQQIDLIHLMIEKSPDHLAIAESATDVMPIFKSGKIVSLLGIEGLHQTAYSASALRMFHRLGVRYATLSHNHNNHCADSATGCSEFNGGLSDLGKDMLREMNRIGMIIDLSHTSTETQKQALAISRAPVIFSHSSCYTLCAHPRNTTDDVLHLLKANGGVIMICFLRELIASVPAEATLSRTVDHIIHVGEAIGYEHVGIGSDFDGMLRGPDGLEDTTRYPYLVAELLQRGVTEADVKNIVGLNVLRVFHENERISRAMKERGAFLALDMIEPLWEDDIKVQLREERARVRALHGRKSE
ncbi:hypothetical protein COCVIDRAFT_84229, partial [Bipolaris victoriae FI3]